MTKAVFPDTVAILAVRCEHCSASTTIELNEWRCPSCGEQCKTRRPLIRHLITHARLNRCVICDSANFTVDFELPEKVRQPIDRGQEFTSVGVSSARTSLRGQEGT